MALVEHSRMVSLLGLTARLPADAVDARPRLLMAVAWANSLLQRADAAQHALDHLRRAMPVGGAHEEMHSEADVVQACIDVYGDRIDRAETLVRKSLARHRTYRPWIVAVAANIQTFCDIYSMRYRDALERQRWARPFHDRTIGPFSGVYGRCFAGVAAFAQLDLDAAEEHLSGAVVLGPGVGGPPLARRAAGGRAAGRAALRTRRARRGRAAARGEPGAGRGERGRRLHDRDLRRARADQGAPRRRRRRAARRGRQGRRAARPAAAVGHRPRRTDPAAPGRAEGARGPPGGAGPARRRGLPRRDRRGDRPDPHRFAGRGAVRRGRPRGGGGAAGGADRRPPTPRAGPGRRDGHRRARRRAGTRGPADHRGAHAGRGAGAGRARGPAADRRRRRSRGRRRAGAPRGALARGRAARGRVRRAGRRARLGTRPASPAASWPSSRCSTPGAATPRSRAS